jgi:zinc transporter
MVRSDEAATGAHGLPLDPGLYSHGLVWGYRFNEDGQADPLDLAGALAALARQESWIWLHFDLVDARSFAAINALPGLPSEVLELLCGNDAHQRIVISEQHVAGVVVDFERSDALDSRKMAAWRFCMAPHVFISARRSPMHTMAEMHTHLRSGRQFPGVLQLFDAIVHGFAAALSAVSQKLADALDKVEDSLLDDSEAGDFEALGTVRRNAVRLHRQAAPLRKMLHQLDEQRPTWITEAAADEFAELAHRVDSVAADLTALEQRAHALQDELNSRQTTVINRRLALLSVISAVLLPPTLITGIFGMNVDGLPLKDQSPHGFGLTMVMIVVSVVGLLVWLRRLKMF